jgi:MinD-like ATPase involved in chromosome partitioning or flagellar assembly
MDKKINKIVVIDKGEELGQRINELFHNMPNFPCVVKWFPSLVIDEVKGAYCVIIDSRLVKDVKNLIDVLTALSVAKIIVTTSELNSPLSSTVLMMGASLFYRNSPVTTILPKIIDNFKEEKMSGPLNTRISTEKVTKKININSCLGKSVMFYSPKGGTGKTSILLNIAAVLAQKNVNVLVIDYSLFSNVTIKLKINNHEKGISSILSSASKNLDSTQFDEIIRRSIHTYTFSNYSFDVLTSDTPLKMTNISVEIVEYINNIINSLNYDIILIDTSSNLSNLNTALFEMSKEIVVVSTPDICSTWSLIQHKEIMQHLNITSRCKLILNMFGENYNFNTNQLKGELEYEIVSIIPENTQVRHLENKGKLIAQDITLPFNIHYKKLAHALFPVFTPEEITQKSGFFSNPFKKNS